MKHETKKSRAITTKKGRIAAARRAVKNGNWIIRADRGGVSYGGFRWSPVGQWTEAPDWSPVPSCGGGLHGQNMDHGGYIDGTRLVFCDTEGEHVAIGDDKVKVRSARILLVGDEIAKLSLSVGGSLNLSGKQITALPEGLTVGGSLDLRGTQITALPEGLTVGGSLYLRETQITALPEGLTVGGSLYLSGTQITALPEGLTAKGEIYR